jgi:hypothetical protein
MKLEKRRALHRDFGFFVEALCLHVQAGHDLPQAWAEALPFSGKARGWLEEGGAFAWRGLSERWPLPEHRLWFCLLEEVHGSGAPLLPLLTAFATAIRTERTRDLEAFCRGLPSRLGVALLLFFLPAAFLLLFAPLILALPAF